MIKFKQWLKENEDDAELVVPNRPIKNKYSKKATYTPQQTDKHLIGTIISGDGEIGQSK